MELMEERRAEWGALGGEGVEEWQEDLAPLLRGEWRAETHASDRCSDPVHPPRFKALVSASAPVVEQLRPDAEGCARFLNCPIPRSRRPSAS
ncbi:hypothetical protein AAFF_G00063820 [Aldrovandia affinis]|uniref:Uncharacterized protein n=1 Tax=Aldrovandia affinis TaxID=143900 RepID=A0AAD7T3I8_9TELE|nr:hypothetical protein AAFF_G00063820 [Aldrovandia affinis]